MLTRFCTLLICWLCVYVPCDTVLAQEEPQGTKQAGPSISQFMTPDGHFDLQAVRAELIARGVRRNHHMVAGLRVQYG